MDKLESFQGFEAYFLENPDEFREIFTESEAHE
jgi:hypothetical protein